VFLVRDKSSGTLYAMKVLRKDYIIKKNQIEHTKTERSVLGRAVHHPYIVGLNMAFQTPDKLFLVLDYCPGGELLCFWCISTRSTSGVKQLRFV
jgi:serine/threonine protein kinase